MQNNQVKQVTFPAITPTSQQIFLNNRYGTQIPESIIQTTMHTLQTGVAGENDDETTTVRQKLAQFLHADTPDAFFFTESEAGMLHWLAYSWGFSQLQDGDEVILSAQDAPMIGQVFAHLQRQMAQRNVTLTIKEVPYQENGEFDLNGLLSLVSTKTRLIFVPHLHPVFGTKNEADIALLKQHVGDQTLVIVDISQSVGRIPVYLEHLHCDCAFFSGRNLFSPFPFGIGYLARPLYKHESLDMFLRPEPTELLMARTLSQGVGLLEHISMEQVALHLQELSQYLLASLQQLHSLEFLPGIGHCEAWCSPGHGILSFRLPGLSAEESRVLLAEHGLLIDLASNPLYPDAITVSLHIYNTFQHIDALVACLKQL